LTIQHLQETGIHGSSVIRTQKTIKWGTEDPRFRPRGHQDRLRE